MYADENVIKIKHDVLYEVAKLAFAGELDEKRDNIAMSLIPGPTPQFRCCIYKEREIIRQRVRLAEGKAPGAEDDGKYFFRCHFIYFFPGSGCFRDFIFLCESRWDKSAVGGQ